MFTFCCLCKCEYVFNAENDNLLSWINSDLFLAKTEEKVHSLKFEG